MKRLASALLSGAMLLLLATPVRAGGSGEQLEFIDQLGSVYNVCVTGYNQNLVWTSQCFPTPFTYNMLSGYWWQGQIRIDQYDASWNHIQTAGIWVWQVPNDDWWCYNDATGASNAC